MRTYVINLDRAAERLAHMRRQFDQLGISFVRIAAVDGTSLSDRELLSFRTLAENGERPYQWMPSEIGIFLSHKLAWSTIASGDDQYAAVFEDDVHVSDEIATLLKDSSWIHNSADIVRFETTLQGMKLARKPISQAGQMKVFRVYSGAWGAAGYVIKREVASWLASSPPRTFGPVDWFLFHPESVVAPALSVFQLDPAPCVQDQYHPDVDSRRNLGSHVLTPTGIAQALKTGSRRLLSPMVRKATGRRGIPYA
ncbi:MAG: glycosyltransferase family 25 protein [Alphaproteobacteria bacterium]|nr:MAG: glycosyltransferase family 25 protein [Alphaproteobacteria bacterium]